MREGEELKALWGKRRDQRHNRGGTKAELSKGLQNHSGGDGGSEGTVGQEDKGSEENRRGPRHKIVKKGSHARELSDIIFLREIADSGHNFCAVLLVMNKKILTR